MYKVAKEETPYVKSEIGSDGRVALIEPPQRAGIDRRVFRQVGDCWEWTHYSDWLAHGSRARFYGWSGKELPASMTSD